MSVFMEIVFKHKLNALYPLELKYASGMRHQEENDPCLAPRSKSNEPPNKNLN